MWQFTLFLLIAAGAALFAVAALGADNYLIAICAGIVGIWFADAARSALATTRRKRRHEANRTRSSQRVL